MTAMEPTPINPASLPTGARERFCYSYGVRTGDILWISGQVALSPEGEIVGVGDVTRQAEQVFGNLASILEAAGASLADVVATTTYTTDRAHTLAVNDVRRARLTGACPPTSTLLIVAGLARPEFLVEISAIAVVPPGP